MSDRIPESILLKLAASMIHLYDGKFLCPKCRAPNIKTEMYCKCGYKASMIERLRQSERIKYNNIINELRE